MLHPPMCLSHNYICSHEEDNSTNILWLQPLLYQNDVFSVNKVLQFTGIPANCNFYFIYCIRFFFFCYFFYCCICRGKYSCIDEMPLSIHSICKFHRKHTCLILVFRIYTSVFRFSAVLLYQSFNCSINASTVSSTPICSSSTIISAYFSYKGVRSSYSALRSCPSFKTTPLPLISLSRCSKIG